MSTLTTVSVPASAFALERLMKRRPEVRVQFLRSVTAGPGRSTPAVWVVGDDLSGVGELIRTDPSVDTAERLTAFDAGHLYRLEWDRQQLVLTPPLFESGVDVISAHGHDGQWWLRVLTDDRTSLSSVADAWTDANVDHQIERINGLQDVPDRTRFGLTDPQYEALVAGYQSGFYSVPREVDTNALSDQLGVSHQATSERLRRGHRKLVQNALVESTGPTVSL